MDLSRGPSFVHGLGPSGKGSTLNLQTTRKDCKKEGSVREQDRS